MPRQQKIMVWGEAPNIATGNGYLSRYLGARNGILGSAGYDMHLVGWRHLGQPELYKITFHDKEFDYRLYPVYDPSIIDYRSYNKWYQEIQPDIVLAIGDGQVMKTSQYANVSPQSGMIPANELVGYMAVDSAPLKLWQPILAGVPNIIVPTEWAKTQVEREGFGATYIPHGIDLDWMKPLTEEQRRASRKSRGIPEDAIVIGGIGMNQDRKRWDMWIKIFILAKQYIEKEFKRKVIGYLHVPTQNFLNLYYDIPDLIKLHNLEGSVALNTQISPLSKLNDRHIADVYGCIDVLVHPAAAGAWELPISEAQAFGTIAVAQAYAGMSESCIREMLCKPAEMYAGAQSGTLWAHPDVSSFVDRIVKAVKEPDHYKQVQYEHVKKYSWKRVKKMWLEYLQRFSIDIPEDWFVELDRLSE